MLLLKKDKSFQPVQAFLTRLVMYSARSEQTFFVVNLKSINQFVFRLLMVLILFLSLDQIQRPYMTGFTLVMTVSGLI